MHKYRQLASEMQQGTVLYHSLILQFFFTQGLYKFTIKAFKIYTYANDLTIVPQDPRVDEAAIQLQNYLRQLQKWLIPTIVHQKVIIPLSCSHTAYLGS